MSAASVRVRRAAARDGERLRSIARAAKGHWGDDGDLLARWAAGLDVSPSRLARAEAYVAAVGGNLVGWAELVLSEDDVCVLDHLWVDPPWMRRGVGTALFRHATERARALGATRMEWEAEPHALGFYEKAGGRRVGERRSEWGRLIPLMALDLTSPGPSASE